MEKALGMAGWCMCVWGPRSTTFFCQQQEQKTKVTLATHDFFIEFIKICENFSQRPRIDLNKSLLPRHQILPPHESMKGLISTRIKILHIGNFLSSKMSLNVITVKLFLY